MTVRLGALLAQRRHPVVENLGARIGGLVFAVVATLLVARLGGPAAVGIYALLRLLPGAAAMLLSGGLPGAAPYFLAGPARSDSRLRLTLVAIAVTGGAAGALAWALATPVLLRVFFSASLPAGLVALAGLRILTFLFADTARACSQGADDLAGGNRVIVLQEFFFLPAYVALAMALPQGAALVAGLLLADVVTGILGWTRLARKGFFAAAGLPSLGLARTVYGFGLRNVANSMLSLLNLRLDFALVGALVGPAALGAYAVATKYAELLRLPPLAFYFVLQPRYAGGGRERATTEARALLWRAGAITAAAAVPLAVAAAVLLPVVYGRDFQAAVLPAQILLLGLAGDGMASVINAFLYGIGRPGLKSLGTGAGLLVTIGLDLLLIPRLGAAGAAVASSAAYLTTLGVLLASFWVLTAGGRRRRPGIGPSAGRRALDIVLATAALVVLSPLLLVLAGAVWVAGGGPVIYRQVRVGQGGVPFTLYKFRTMRRGAKGPELTLLNDPRITRVGKFFRRTSLDELPQLVNVLRGDMTLVGPRPETPSLATRYPAEYVAVFQYRPGLTGPVQVRLRDRGMRNGSSGEAEDHYLRELLPQRVPLDLAYVTNPTMRRTLALLVQTALHVVSRSRRAETAESAEAQHAT